MSNPNTTEGTLGYRNMTDFLRYKFYVRDESNTHPVI